MLYNFLRTNTKYINERISKMKQQNKLLTIGLILAIVVTTFAPAASAVNHSKSPTRQKRLAPTISERAGKISYNKMRITKCSNLEFFNKFKTAEQQKRKQEMHRCSSDLKLDKFAFWAKHVKETQRENFAIETMSEKDRQFLYNLIISSKRNIIANYNVSKIPSKDALKFNLCIRYLKKQLDYTIVYVPNCYWPEFLKSSFSKVFNEKTESVVYKILSYITKKLNGLALDYSHYEKICKEILSELNTGHNFLPTHLQLYK